MSFLCFLLPHFWGVLMGNLEGDVLGVLAEVDFFFAGNLRMGAFLKIVILKVGVKDLTNGDGTMEWCLADVESDAKKEGTFFCYCCLIKFRF